MNEIDFIPQWYKAGRERKQRYIRQYALMATLFTLMLGWGFFIKTNLPGNPITVPQCYNVGRYPHA